MEGSHGIAEDACLCSDNTAQKQVWIKFMTCHSVLCRAADSKMRSCSTNIANVIMQLTYHDK